MKRLVPMLRADLRLAEAYRHVPGEPLDLPVTVFGGLQDANATPEQLRSWKEVTRGPVRVHVLPGGHFFLKDSEVELLRILGGELGAA